MENTKIIFSTLILFGLVATSWQYVTNPTCFDQPCPVDTVNCKKQLSSNIDKTRLRTKISCLDDYDRSIKEYEFEEPAHLNPNTKYQSTSYQSVNIPQQSLNQENRYVYPQYNQYDSYRGLENFL